MKRRHAGLTLLTAIVYAATASCVMGQVPLYDNLSLEPLFHFDDVIGLRFDHRTEPLAQQFFTSGYDNISAISLYLQRVGSPRGEVEIEIWDDAGDNTPGMFVGSAGKFKLDDLANTPQFVKLDTNINGLAPNSPYFVVFDNLGTTISSPSNSYHFGLLGRTNDEQNEGTNGARRLLGSATQGASWIEVNDLLGGCHPSGACGNYLRMSVFADEPVIAEVALYDNFTLEPINNIPGEIGPRYTTRGDRTAQPFNMGESNNVSSVSLLMNRVGSPTGTVAVEIWENRDAGEPAALVSTIGMIDLAQLSTTREEVTFDALITGLVPGGSYHVVLNNIGTSITSAEDSYRTGVLGNVNDVQAEGTNGAAYMLESVNGAWTPIRDTLGCHPSGGCPNFLRMKVMSAFVLGDFDEDGALDVDDIDRLNHQVRAAPDDRSFDLNNDGTLTHADREAWVHDLANTYFGDSNLDGEFNSSDLTLVFAAGEYEDNITLNSTWPEGDWTGDGDFDSGDLVAAFSDGGYELGPRAAANAVPEPASLFYLVSCVVVLRRSAHHYSKTSVPKFLNSWKLGPTRDQSQLVSCWSS